METKLRSIIFSNAFGRLKGKTQLITDSYNDNCRTRISHTTEVVNIAKYIAKFVDSDLDLVEIIAYSHDIGHTPFGHAGERALHRISTGKNPHFSNFNKLLDKYPEYCGFKHNLQGVKILNELEGILSVDDDLDKKIMYGIANHTNLTYSKDNSIKKSELIYYMEYDSIFCEDNMTVESQIVAIADELAQLVESLEDGRTLKLVEYKDVYEIFEEFFFETNEDSQFSNKLKDFRQIAYSNNSQNGKYLREFTEFVIEYFVTNIHIKINVETKPEDSFGVYKVLYRKLNDLFFRKLIQSPMVRHMDVRAEHRITEVFNFYFSNPKELKQKTIEKLKVELLEKSFIDTEDTDSLIMLISKLVLNDVNKIKTKMQKSVVGEIDLALQKTIRYEYILLEYIRVIIDHISGMTDSYLINELKRMDKCVKYVKNL